jgi:predicted phosphodiesterase
MRGPNGMMPSVRRAGLIGDLHCEHEALAFVLGELTRMGADVVLQAGDIADGPGDLNATIALLERHEVLAVRGNHDRWLLANQMRQVPHATPLASVSPASIDFLSRLPATRELQSPRGEVLLCHGLGENDMVGVKPDHQGYDIDFNTELQALIRLGKYRFVLNGHTHRPMLRSFGALSIINAGTLLRESERCFTLLDFDRCELIRFRHAAGQLCTELDQWTSERERLPGTNC